MKGNQGRIAAGIFIISIITSCVSLNVVGPGQTELDGFKVQLLHKWSTIAPYSDDEIGILQITRDGLELNRVFLLRGLEDGHKILDLGFESAPDFQSWMGHAKLSRFLRDNLVKLGYENIEVKQDACPFLNNAGTCYTIMAHKFNGLEISGMAIAALDDKKHLDFMMFLAPSTHYFPTMRKEVEYLFETASRLD